MKIVQDAAFSLSEVCQAVQCDGNSTGKIAIQHIPALQHIRFITGGNYNGIAKCIQGIFEQQTYDGFPGAAYTDVV